MSSCGSNVGMETSAPLVDGIVNNALLHSTSHINQMPPQITHILHFFLVDSLPRFFVIKWIEVRAVRWSEVWNFYRSLTLLHFRAGDSE